MKPGQRWRVVAFSGRLRDQIGPGKRIQRHEYIGANYSRENAQGLSLRVDAQVEAELRELDPAEAEEYLQSLGASEGGLTSLIKAAYRQLGLLTYFTTGAPSWHCHP